MFIHFYLVNVRHFQNYVVVYFLALFWYPFGLEQCFSTQSPRKALAESAGTRGK